ncbi:hypothetical protein [Actinoalloteichus spitiensis]|uniref:hypothetical protein n=1 Tax=Actinoalloteichus spitiensis TaxID=252394 RepID=UPI0003734B62|nr:hypothetical protein [Actinoalloteichus spitiensis]
MPGGGTTGRIMLAALPPVLGAVPGVALLLGSWDEFPEELATRFGTDGVTNSMSRPSMLLMMVGVGLLMAISFGSVVAKPSSRRKKSGLGVRQANSPRFAIALSWALGGFFGMVYPVVLRTNLDGADSSTASLPPEELALCVGAALIGGLLGWVLGRGARR